MADKRLFNQAAKLKTLKDKFGMKNFVIIERNNQNSTAIFERRRLIDIQYIRDINVFVTDNYKHTVDMIYVMYEN